MNMILICTVGGSPEPVLKALEVREPAQVYFVCTPRDPVTGAPGSQRQIEGQGLVTKARASDAKDSLPNIPTRAGLSEEHYSTVVVDADDLDGTFTRINELIRSLAGETNTRVVADYTGGTKSMTAGLVLAALEHPGVELQVVTGSRPDLQQVMQGTERPFGAEVTRLRLTRSVTRAVEAWRHFDYDATADATRQIEITADARLRALPTRAHDISRGLAAWDRFEHAAALDQLSAYRGLLAQQGYAHYFDTLQRLTGDDARAELLRLLDLWRNAERRAAQSRFDDAVARCYRLVEGTAQWLLWFRAGIHTSDVPEEKIPEGVELAPDREGRRQAGLDNAWRIAAALLGEQTAAFYDSQREHLLELLHIRNHSILAHGWEAIGQAHWDQWRRWIEGQLVPLLLAQGKAYKINALPPQLPTRYPQALLEIAGESSP